MMANVRVGFPLEAESLSPRDPFQVQPADNIPDAATADKIGVDEMEKNKRFLRKSTTSQKRKRSKPQQGGKGTARALSTALIHIWDNAAPADTRS